AAEGAEGQPERASPAPQGERRSRSEGWRAWRSLRPADGAGACQRRRGAEGRGRGPGEGLHGEPARQPGALRPRPRMPRDPPPEPAADELPEAPVPPPREARAPGALVPSDNLQRYMAEIRRIPLLSREEEHDLAVKWHEQGDRQAAWSLVTANLRL